MMYVFLQDVFATLIMIREIFVVDDNADYQFLFFKLMKELATPYSVKFFENAKACHKHMKVLQAKKAENLPALVVLDLNMPEMNGLQLLKIIKSPAVDGGDTATDIPVVIMSSYISEQQVRQCYEAGANAVLDKPTDFLQLKTTVQAICRFWLDRTNPAISSLAL